VRAGGRRQGRGGGGAEGERTAGEAQAPTSCLVLSLLSTSSSVRPRAAAASCSIGSACRQGQRGPGPGRLLPVAALDSQSADSRRLPAPLKTSVCCAPSRRSPAAWGTGPSARAPAAPPRCRPPRPDEGGPTRPAGAGAAAVVVGRCCWGGHFASGQPFHLDQHHLDRARHATLLLLLLEGGISCRAGALAESRMLLLGLLEPGPAQEPPQSHCPNLIAAAAARRVSQLRWEVRCGSDSGVHSTTAVGS
jgi:hypothetical protein